MPHYCSIIPPYVLRSILEKGNPRQQEAAWSTLTDTEQFRGRRKILAALTPIIATAPGRKRRTIYDARRGYDLPGRLVRSEGSSKSKDISVNEAYDSTGATFDFYARVFERNSIDDVGMRLDTTVHYGVRYDNAFWDGRQIVCGDGDGVLFGSFTKSLDVIAHELTHGVTQFEANLHYRGQSGALNESFSDVFGILAKQYRLHETAEETDWLIGKELFVEGVQAIALRSMKAPGTAYDDPVLGKDPQPDHMRGYVTTTDDNGGVHINSGIPNRAFYELSIRLGGFAWEKAGRIWYKTLTEKLRPNSTFRDAMNHTMMAAQALFGRNSPEHKAVREAWAEVGV